MRKTGIILLTAVCCLSLGACGNSHQKKEPPEVTTMERMETATAEEASTEDVSSSDQERVLFHVSTSKLEIDSGAAAKTINQLSDRECTYVQTEWSEAGRSLVRQVHVMPDAGISSTKWYDSDGTGYGVMIKEGIRYLTVSEGESVLYYKNALAEDADTATDVFAFPEVSAEYVQPKGTAVYHGETCKLAADITPERLSGGKQPVVYLLNDTGVIVGFTTDLNAVQYEDQITEVRNGLLDDNLDLSEDYKESKADFMDSEISKMQTRLLTDFPAMEKRLTEGIVTEETDKTETTDSASETEGVSTTETEEGNVEDIGEDVTTTEDEDGSDDGIIVEEGE